MNKYFKYINYMYDLIFMITNLYYNIMLFLIITNFKIL